MYQNFIGVDISKDNFAAALFGKKETQVFSNDNIGFNSFKKTYKDYLSNSLVVLETTGGYEMELVRYLQSKQIATHRANTRKVKHFIRSFGVLGKSDAIDARALAHYGADRHASLDIFKENPDKMLQKLVQRRLDLKQMLVQEKNRLKAPDQKILKKSFEIIINALEKQLDVINKEIEEYCSLHGHFNEQRKILETVDGIGKTISFQLLAMLPEIGTLNRKKIASLAGLAPHPYESGKKVGYRVTRGGREKVKEILFMAALTAARSKGALGKFYNKLLSSGKKKMVAIVALMRKILVIANARLKEYNTTYSFNQHG